MHSLTVLFHTWPAAFDCPGGGEVQLLQYEKHLTELGVRVLRYDPWHPQFDQANIVHHFSSQPDTLFCEYAVQSKKLPLVVSSILWPDQKDKYNLKQIANLYRLSERVLPNSRVECEQLATLLDIHPNHFTPIVNGVDDVFFDAVSPNLFRTKYDISGPFVLCMGNIEFRKNQLRLIEALKGTGIQLVLVGQKREPEYAEYCRAAADNTVHFIDKLEHGGKLQRSAYAAAEALLLPSTLETPGLAALEAAAAGIPRLVLTSIGCTKEYFRDLATYLLPDDTLDIRKAVLDALDSPGKAERLKAHIQNNYTWEHAAKQLVDVYREVLQGYSTYFINKPKFLKRTTNRPIPEEKLLPLDQHTGNGLSHKTERYIHLSGEETAIFHSAGSYILAGRYEAVLRYSWWGTGQEILCTLYGYDKQIFASASLREGVNQILRVPFAASLPIQNFTFHIEVPKGNTLIISRLSLVLRDNLPTTNTASSDLFIFGLTRYQQISQYNTKLPLNNFYQNGQQICTSKNLVVFSETHMEISGPYLALPPAQYTAIILYSYLREFLSDISESIPFCDVVVNLGKQTLTKSALSDGLNRILLLHFNLKQPVSDLEIRTSIPNGQFLLLKEGYLYCHPTNIIPSEIDINNSCFNPICPPYMHSIGWSSAEQDGTWTVKRDSLFVLATPPYNYELHLEVTPFLGNITQRTLHCLVNGVELKCARLSGPSELCVYISKDIFNNSPLLSITLKSDEPLSSPKECGISNDSRELGFLVHSMSLHALTETELRTQAEANFNPVAAPILFHQGWHDYEPNGTWSSTQHAEFTVRTTPIDTMLSLVLTPFLGKTSHRTLRCLVNGVELKWAKLDGPSELFVYISKDMFTNGPLLTITLKSDEPLSSPYKCDMSTDARNLGFMLHQYRLIPRGCL